MPGRMTYLLNTQGTKETLSGPVNVDLMVTAFMQDLQETRNVARYHRRLANVRREIREDITLSMDERMERLVQFHEAFRLPIALGIANEQDDGLSEVAWGFEGRFLAEKLGDYVFFDALCEVASLPYTLEPMEEDSGDDTLFDDDSEGDSVADESSETEEI